MIASSPGLFPAFQYCTLWEWDGPGDMDEATHVMQCNWLVFGIFFSQVIDKDGVFSVQANLSRLRAELTIQANKRYCSFGRWHYSRKLLISMYTRTHSLNIPAIRRQLLTQHRSLHPISTGYKRGCARLPPLPQWRPRKKTPPKPPTSLEQLKLVSTKAQTMIINIIELASSPGSFQH